MGNDETLLTLISPSVLFFGVSITVRQQEVGVPNVLRVEFKQTAIRVLLARR